VLIHQKDFSYPQGFAIAGATSLGMLAGLGAFLISPPNVAAQYALGLSVIGGGIGFAISYGQYAQQAKLQGELNKLDENSTKFSYVSQDENWLEKFAANTKVNVSPIGLLGLGLPQIQSAGIAFPIVSVNYTFR
jgi:hypothetical protein